MDALAQELALTDLFRNAPEPTLRMVLEHSAPRTLTTGEVLLSPEQENDHIYLLLSGLLGIHFDTLESPEIRELNSGLSVGEISVIDGTPPSAYVVAKTECRVFPIHRDLLQKMVADTSPIAGNLLRLLTQWMKANTHRIIKDRAQIWELSDHANVDALTGLYNRRWLDNALPRLLAQTNKNEQQLCILLIDVDHFKHYNDTQGHLGGDCALKAIGNLLKTTVRPYDFATRYGGEEFLVILPNTNREESLAIAERIRNAASTTIITSDSGEALPSLTLSIGVATNQPDSTMQSLIGAADAQLYRAKEEGRNCVRY